MKFYGWDDCGVARGEMLATDISAGDLDFGPELLAHEIGWERGFTSFKAAQRALLEAMQAEGAASDLIDQVRRYKASYVPIV
ncbi:MULTISPECIES: hypothetical protein [unclassified Marinimicrobium]|jgi:hypothetical protein|uniref:hypothetical protein n=1 Tax=unclassified Marinimicrobium TaxID=2632100 RepID=UPI000C6814E3|nr:MULTISPECIES: hypothetical protein [unclassified Marinimicrobium]MAN51180.1 hypothetical protein [Marinimicrobium sp.]|tara:strand:+ start:1026 stop:1271 length:246 start_codon:yes stop_codon:yes gene_type:complete